MKSRSKPKVKTIVKVVDGGPKVIFTTDELAARWSMDPGTLENWRNARKGPRFMKMGKGSSSLVRYQLKAIEAYELKVMKNR